MGSNPNSTQGQLRARAEDFSNAHLHAVKGRQYNQTSKIYRMKRYTCWGANIFQNSPMFFFPQHAFPINFWKTCIYVDFTFFFDPKINFSAHSIRHGLPMISLHLSCDKGSKWMQHSWLLMVLPKSQLLLFYYYTSRGRQYFIQPQQTANSY